jgi:Uma2 family endonuclease
MNELDTGPRLPTAAELGVTVDVSHLVTEDDTPVDNPFSEKQMRLLTRPLYASWKPGQPFVAMANVGFYFALNAPPMVPDALVSLGVDLPRELHQKEHRAYFTWLYGKVPDIVVEIVSNTEGGELDRKLQRYAAWNVPRYVVYDPRCLIQPQRLQCFRLERIGSRGSYTPSSSAMFEEVGLGLTEWTGEFEGWHETWLRWVDAGGNLLLLGEELARQESARADALAAKLRALGVPMDDA